MVGNIQRAVKHWTIAASTGNYIAMHELRAFFEREGGNYYGKRIVSKESFDSTLEAYNISCVEMRSEASKRCFYPRHVVGNKSHKQ